MFIKKGEKVLLKDHFLWENGLSKETTYGIISHIDYRYVQIEVNSNFYEIHFDWDLNKLKEYIYISSNNINEEVLDFLSKNKIHSFEAVTIDGKVIKMSL